MGILKKAEKEFWGGAGYAAGSVMDTNAGMAMTAFKLFSGTTIG